MGFKQMALLELHVVRKPDRELRIKFVAPAQNLKPQKVNEMDVVYPRCCGIDVHKKR